MPGVDDGSAGPSETTEMIVEKTAFVQHVETHRAAHMKQMPLMQSS